MVFLASTAFKMYASRAFAYDALMVKLRDRDLVRSPCSAGSSPITSRSRTDLPTSAGRFPLSLLLLLSLLARLSVLLLLLVLPFMPQKSAFPWRSMV